MLPRPLLSGALVGAVLVAGLTAPALAQRTRLLEVDLKTGSVKRIDAGPKTAADRDLDSMLDKATGGAAFSTDELERIEQALRRYLDAARPRAMPRLLLFLYPGRITRLLLKELREVKVDVELIVDPCGRTVCSDAVAKHLELLGRALRQARLRTSRYTIQFGAIVIRTSTDLRGAEHDQYRFGAEQVVAAGQRAGGGAALVSRLGQAQEQYGRQMVKEITARLRTRRVQLTKPPLVERSKTAARVELEVASDRVRYRTDVTAALLGSAEALRKSPLTPSSSTIQVVATIPMRTKERRTFSCQGYPLGLHLDGKLSQADLWSTYVAEKKKGGTQLTFDDAEASGRGGGGSDDEGDDRTGEVLSGHMGLLAPCLQAESARNRRFKGATLLLAVGSAGTATSVRLKEAGASASLRSCLTAAVGRIRFPKRSGAPRQVEFPMLIKR